MSDYENTNDIPRPDEVATHSGMPNWRFADGQIVRGREEDGTLTVAGHGLLGRLVRIGVHRDTLDDGRPYAKLEAELETADGIQSVGANMTSMMAAITFAEGLLGAGKGELVKIESTRSKEKNRYGKYTTYVNVYRVLPDRSTKQVKEKIDPNKAMTLERCLEEAEARLMKHPAWAPRPERKSEEKRYEQDPTWRIFAKEIEDAGKWPRFEVAREGYLAMCAKLGNKDGFASPEQVPESVWATMRQGHDQCVREGKALPPMLEKYAASAAPAAADVFS